MEYARTAHNRLFTLRRPLGGSGVQSPRSVGLRPRSHGSITHIGAGGLCFAKPLYARPNVVNSRNVMQHGANIYYLLISFVKIFLYILIPLTIKIFYQVILQDKIFFILLGIKFIKNIYAEQVARRYLIIVLHFLCWCFKDFLLKERFFVYIKV